MGDQTGSRLEVDVDLFQMVLFKRILPLELHILDFLGCKPYLEGFGVQGYKYWSSSFVTET